MTPHQQPDLGTSREGVQERATIEPAAGAQTGKRERKNSERFVFTERRLAALEAPEAGARYVFDAQQAGLCVRITPTVRTYVFYKWHQGRPHRLTIGKVGQIQLREARLIVAGYLGDLARGADVFSLAKQAKQGRKPLTLQDAFDTHMARPDFRIATLRGHRSVWRRIPARLKTRAIADVSTDELRQAHAAIGAKHTRTANKAVNLISTLCRNNGRKFDNPADGIERFREDVRTRVLTLDELRRLRAAFDCEPEPWQSYFRLLLLTGARRGALASAQWSDIDLDGGVWRIPSGRSKNRKMIAVALSNEAVAILRRRHAERGASPWVFPSATAKGKHLVDVRKAWGRICDRMGIDAGVGGAVVHDIRRSVGTLVASSGANAATISAVLGHVNAASAKSYIHLSAEVARQAVENVARRLHDAA